MNSNPRFLLKCIAQDLDFQVRFSISTPKVRFSGDTWRTMQLLNCFTPELLNGRWANFMFDDSLGTWWQVSLLRGRTILRFFRFISRSNSVDEVQHKEDSMHVFFKWSYSKRSDITQYSSGADRCVIQGFPIISNVRFSSRLVSHRFIVTVWCVVAISLILTDIYSVKYSLWTSNCLVKQWNWT